MAATALVRLYTTAAIVAVRTAVAGTAFHATLAAPAKAAKNNFKTIRASNGFTHKPKAA